MSTNEQLNWAKLQLNRLNSLMAWQDTDPTQTIKDVKFWKNRIQLLSKVAN